MNELLKTKPLMLINSGLIAFTLTACNGGDSTPVLETPPVTIPTTTVLLVQDAEDEDDRGYLIAGNTSPDREMLTLYTFSQDGDGVSNCYDDCAMNWPPYIVPSVEHVVGIVSGKMGTSARDDGSLQVTVDGKPLYFYHLDTVEGEQLGADINNWRVSSFNEDKAPLARVANIVFADGDSVVTEFFDNGEAECCDQTGAIIDAGGLMAGLFGPGDGFSVTAPSSAAGVTTIGFNYFRGADTDGSMTLSINGVAAGNLVLVPNSPDWASLTPNAQPTAFLELSTALAAGDVLTFMVDSAFSAGNGESVGFYKAGGTAVLSVLELEADGVVSEFFDNGEAECCDQTGAVIDAGGLMAGLFGPGDGFSVIVPAEADGANQFGFSYFRGADTDGSMTVLVDGIAVGNLVLTPNSPDWASLTPNAQPTAYVDLNTPLSANQVVTVMVDSAFSAGNGDSVTFNLTSKAAIAITDTLELEEDGVVTEFFDNGEAECCDMTGANIDGNGQMAGLFGPGDGFSVMVPAGSDGAVRVGFSYFRGADTDGSMTVLIDGVAAGNLVLAPNSPDWGSLTPNAQPTAFLDLSTPLMAGQVVTFMVDSAFSAGNGDSVSFYK